MIDSFDLELPPEQYDLGGTSGGPMLAFIENKGIFSWRLCGVIYEASPEFGIIFASNALVIQHDGQIIE